MIKPFIRNGRPYHVHTFDSQGNILNSTLTPEQNITGKEVIGTHVADHIHEKNVCAFLWKIERCLDRGGEVVTYRVSDALFFGKMKKIEADKVIMFDYNITGLTIDEVCLNLAF